MCRSRMRAVDGQCTWTSRVNGETRLSFVAGGGASEKGAEAAGKQGRAGLGEAKKRRRERAADWRVLGRRVHRAAAVDGAAQQRGVCTDDDGFGGRREVAAHEGPALM